MTQKLHAAWEARSKLHADGAKLMADGYKLHADGALLWDEAVRLAYGNTVTMSWSWWTSTGECTLENGDVYPDNQ